jgi:two-component system, cell cycle sensor histidine kinase and response regulator CckA
VLTSDGRLRRRGILTGVTIVAAGSLTGTVALRALALGPQAERRVELVLVVLVIALLAFAIPAFSDMMRLRTLADRKRAQAESEAQRHVLEQIATAAPLREVLDAVCSLIESDCAGVHAMIHLLEDDGLMLRTAAAPSVDPVFADAMDEVVVGPRAASFGSAVYSRETVIVKHIAKDKRWDGYRALALEQGFQSCWALPIRSQAGRIVGALALYVTDAREPELSELLAGETATHLAGIAVGRAQAEESLRRSEASFRSFVENAAVGIYRVTRSGRLLAVNSSLVQLLRYSTIDELLQVDMAADIYIDANDRDRITRELEARGDIYSSEAKWRRKDGTAIDVRISARAHRDERGSVWFSEGYVEDVTPLRVAEQQLRQSEKLAALGQLVSGVAHELNNPLTAILHFAEELLNEERTPADREALSLVRDQARRSRAIVRDLLSFVRGREAARERVRLDQLLAASVRALRPQVVSLGGRLDADFTGLETHVFTDRAGLEQVVTNLVLNAAQAAGEGGVINVSAWADESNFHLFVEDSGPGIPAAVIDRIFEPFFTTKPTGEGTGLGLSVTLGIVQQLGGTITAANRGKQDGGGARFTVILPAFDRGEHAVAIPAHVALSDSPPYPAGHTQPRVLIIDDEAPIRVALRRFLSRRGWVVAEAADGETGLAMLLSADPPYTAVVSDLKMPGCSGIELHDHLAREMPEMLARIIFSTGDVASREAAEFVERTQCAVLRKPFELRTLDGMLTRFRETTPA